MLAVYVMLGVVVYGGCIIGLYWEWQELRGKHRAPATEVEIDDLLHPRPYEDGSDRDHAANAGYETAWESLDGLSARMALLAVASDELAQRCRGRVLVGGLPLRPLREIDYYAQLPADLADSAPRPGTPATWQALDRALRHLSAIHGSDEAGLHADAHEQISIAARRLSDELAVDGVQVDLDHCIFCQREASNDVRVLSTSCAAICEDCVHEIYSTLDDL